MKAITFAILLLFIVGCFSCVIQESSSRGYHRGCQCFNKEKAYKEFKSRLLSDIQKEGLKIGDRWIIQQQSGTYFVIRDYVGTQTKDSRIAFPANVYLDPQ